MLKKIKPVILIVLPILILVLYRSFNTDRFKPESERWVALSAGESNIISTEKISSIEGQKLIINLGNGAEIPGSTGIEQVKIPVGSILDKQNLKLLNVSNRKVFLWSDEAATAARTWMLLSQMGYKNIFILADDQNNEVFKNEFRPDTTSAAGILNE